jgi:hypothetical protein
MNAVAIIRRYDKTVTEAYTKLQQAAQQMALTINQEKTTFIQVSINMTASVV